MHFVTILVQALCVVIYWTGVKGFPGKSPKLWIRPIRLTCLVTVLPFPPRRLPYSLRLTPMPALDFLTLDWLKAGAACWT
jgi:hypothetical protein